MVVSTAGICPFGWKARDFALKGVDGKTYSLADIRGPKGTLVVFICTSPHRRDLPVANCSSEGPLARLASRYSSVWPGADASNGRTQLSARLAITAARGTAA
jgi:hypothetical protein